jgi:regulator of sigma E protease
MESIIIRALQLIFSLTILVVVHELGHFFFSRIFKVRVEKFYMFFNPSFSLVRAKKINGKWHFRFFAKNLKSLSTPVSDHAGNPIKDSEGNYLYQTTPIEDLPDTDWRKYPDKTEWGIGWLPLGGYCKIAGMIDESMDKGQMAQAPKPWEYRAVSPWKRLPIITGGVVVNFIMALIIYSAILFTWGEEYVPMKNYKAGFEFSPLSQKAGFQNGDIILKADGTTIEQYNDLEIRKLLSAKQVTVLRNGQEISVTLPADFSKQIILNKDFFAFPRLPFVAREIIKNTPAQKAGLQKGDSLVSVNDSTYTSFFNFAAKINRNKQKAVKIGYYRHGIAHSIMITPDSSGIIGVRPCLYSQVFKAKKIEYGMLQSIPAGVSLGINKLSGYISDFKYLFTKTGVENLGGFASIGKMYDVEWNWPHLWEMTAFLSIILAFMNILPIPGLDGGHLLFLLFELITGRKPNEKFLEKAQAAGMIFLLGLMILANANDFLR